MDTTSLWQAITTQGISYPTLNSTTQVDVVIIGGGITGMTTANQLINLGKKAAVVEARQISSGTTGSSTGNLYVPIHPSYSKIKSTFGEETVKKIIASRQSAINFIEKTIAENAIQCDFIRRPSYIFTTQEDRVASLEKEMDLLKASGIAIEYQDNLEIPLKIKKAAMIPNHAKFNPLQYVVSLAKTLHRKGCEIYENSPVTAIEYGDVCKVITAGGTIQAKAVVIATHIPKGVSLAQMLSPAYRSYAVAVRLKSNQYPNARFVDWDEPHYVTSTHSAHPGSAVDCLVVAGSHHRVGQTNSEEHIKNLEDYIYKHYEVESIDYRWSAQHYQAADGLPFIGRIKNNAYIATGFYADGLVYGTLAGQLICDLIAEVKNPYEAVYNPNRHQIIASSCTLVKEASNMFTQYIKDFPNNVQAQHFKDIGVEEGKTIEIKGDKFGAYRDEHGKLHVVSAVCTHMKCIVNWNKTEKTWDCPCHGSRFTTEGIVIEGPAEQNLFKISVENNAS